MTTIKDVAKKAEVSIATVSHVINNTRYVSPELTIKVKKAMEELRYQPNAVARSLKTEKTQTIGLIVSDISNPFFSTLVRGVEDTAMNNGHSVIVCNTDETLVKEELYVDVLIQKKIDGMIIAPTGKSDKNLEKVYQNNIPMVFIDRQIEDIEADAVLSDNFTGCYQVTRHLIELGHKRIGLILGLKRISNTQERLNGYKKALSEYGIKYDSQLITGGYSKIDGGVEAVRIEGGIKAVNRLLALPKTPTAIFSTNNLMTLGALKGIINNGLRCPKDISLAGLDDFEWASIFEPTLTTVAQAPYKIGTKATELLFERLSKPDQKYQEIRIPTVLKIRNSTAPNY